MANDMGFSNLGVRVYGAAAILFGVIGLKWDDFAAVWQPVPELLVPPGSRAPRQAARTV